MARPVDEILTIHSCARQAASCVQRNTASSNPRPGSSSPNTPASSISTSPWSIVDDKLRRPPHSPTVGILICSSRNDHTVRYALNQSNAAMAVSTYTYDTLPAAEQNALPDEEELAAALDWPDSTDEHQAGPA